MPQTADVSMDLLVLAFAHVPTANWALQELRELTLNQQIQVESVALLTRDECGTVTYEDVTDITGPAGTLLGPFAGALVGALGGPLEAAASRIRSAAGCVVTKHIDRGISIANLRRLQAQLVPDSSALVVLVEHGQARQLLSALSETVLLSEAEQVSVALAADLELLTADLARIHPSTMMPVLTHFDAPMRFDMSL